jgi:hypothetical protein
VLRLALVLKQEFHVELQAHRGPLAELQNLLRGKSFPSLWDHVMILHETARLELIRLPIVTFDLDEAVIIIPLAPHLRALMVGFGTSVPILQLPLFNAVGIR